MISGTFYTLGEVAVALKKNRLTVRRWIQSGKLSVTRLGCVALITKEDLDRLLSEQARDSDAGL